MSDDKNKSGSDKGFLFGFSVMLCGLLLLTILIVMIARLVGPTHTPRDDQYVQDELVEKRLKSVGQPLVEGDSGEGDSGGHASDEGATAVAGEPWIGGSLDPVALYGSACKLCHSTNLPNVPQLGDSASWAPRIAKGMDTLMTNATNGINAMPARGGSTMSDEQLQLTVQYMVDSSK